MPVEEEIKLKPKNIGINELRRIFKDLGAVFHDLVIDYDIYYIHPCRDLWASDEVIRLRKRISKIHGTEEYILTYKGRRTISEGIKAREEIEVYISSYEQMNLILKRLGFRELITIVKERFIYGYHDAILSIDNVKDLGVYVEIEGSRAIINEILDRLDFSYDIIEKTYLELLLDKVL